MGLKRVCANDRWVRSTQNGVLCKSITCTVASLAQGPLLDPSSESSRLALFKTLLQPVRSEKTHEYTLTRHRVELVERDALMG